MRTSGAGVFLGLALLIASCGGRGLFASAEGAARSTSRSSAGPAPDVSSDPVQETSEQTRQAEQSADDDILEWDGEPAGKTRASDPQAMQPPRLRVRLVGLRDRPQVGWFTDDGKSVGLLNPVYEAPLLTSAGSPPAARVHVFAFGLAGDRGREGELVVDLRDGAPHEVTLSLDHRVSPYVERTVALLDRAGRSVPASSLELALDGTLETARDAILNYQQLTSDEQGQISFKLRKQRAIIVDVTLPFVEMPLHVAVSPAAENIKLQDVTSVRCSFRCPNGNRPGYAGFTAVAKLKDGSTRRLERPYGDVLRPEDVVLTWPRGAVELQLHAQGYVQAVLRSPQQRCHLVPISRERCQ